MKNSLFIIAVNNWYFIVDNFLLNIGYMLGWYDRKLLLLQKIIK